MDEGYKGTQNPGKFDPEALLFSVDNELIFKAQNAQNAVYHCASQGPCFGEDELSLCRDPINAPNGGNSNVGRETFKVGLDSKGCSLLTGASASSQFRFTCQEIEVYQITYF